MPELPEVQTTVNGIEKVSKNRVIVDVWADMFSTSHIFKKTIKNKSYFNNVFKPSIINNKIIKTTRRAKNILIKLSNDTTVLIHMKMTGHVMYGEYVYNKKENKWTPKKGQRSLEDPYNRFIRVVFTLDNGKHLVLCDMRKFAKVTLVDDDVKKELSKLGPEPFDEIFDSDYFVKNINRTPNAYIKTALLDQRLVSGIGNIYSDEILHEAKILPDRKVHELSKQELKNIHSKIVPILKVGIDMGGDSMSDYRNIYGERGLFQGNHKAYRRTGKPCTRRGCKGFIERKILNTRSAHFCKGCQK